MSIEEKLDQAKGSVKEGVGKLTGDEKIKHGAEDAKDAVEGALEGVKNAINTHEE